MKTLAEYRTTIEAAAAAARNVNGLLNLDAEIRRICWSRHVQAEARELETLAFNEAQRVAEEPHMIARLPRWHAYTDGVGNLHRAVT